ncbi:MAG: UDP-3-O-(3-hydroxymyristoyl)glucosamine N-acyltransferase [Planctomycetota bacterium]|mgnify:CR=1 FL=1
MNPAFRLEALAAIVEGHVRGDATVVVSGVADVAEAKANEITFVSNPKYAKKLAESKAGAVLVPAGFGPTAMPAILCARMDRSVAELLGAFLESRPPSHQVDATAVVHPSAKLGADVSIGPHAVIEADAEIGARTVLHGGVYVGHGTRIGEDCVLWPNVVVRNGCVLGHRVILHPCSVIGADGFGYYFEIGRHNKIPHAGGVVLGDDVEIGACSCIDRSKFGNTVVGNGVKIDNLVQIAHNVRIGEHTVIAGQTGIAGSTRIGAYCVFGGRAGSVDNTEIGDRTVVAACSVVSGLVEGGRTVSGYPAQDHRKELKSTAALRRLPDFFEQLRDLQARVERIETSTDHRP